MTGRITLMTKKLTGVFLIVLLALAGCGAPQKLEQADQHYTDDHTRALMKLTHWQFSGKIRVKTEESADSANIQWLQEGEHYRIVLSGPLGKVGAVIDGNPYRVTLEMPDHPLYQAQTPEALLYEHFGWNLPLSHLFYWVRTLPAPGSNFDAKTNEEQQLAVIQQDGWDIRYDRFHNQFTPALPGRMKINKGDLQLTLVMNQWQPEFVTAQH